MKPLRIVENYDDCATDESKKAETIRVRTVFTGCISPTDDHHYKDIFYKAGSSIISLTDGKVWSLYTANNKNMLIHDYQELDAMLTLKNQ